MLESLKTNEPFTYNKLSAEEMKARGILGRLVGPCAEFTIPTRNGRKYNEELWDNVFEDEIVNEKIENKGLFGELGHPTDREEIDPEKIAIALNEKPKKNKNGQLIACFDILNTPSGKILKTLCDYGTTIGISSRGSGDVITNNLGEEIVDPTTYYFECFDAVILPAVKSARLEYMHESINENNLKLKKALTESYKEANIEDKKIMKKTLEDINIKLDLPKDDEKLDETVEKKLTVDDIPWAADDPEEQKILTEETEAEDEETAEVDEEEAKEKETPDETKDKEEVEIGTAEDTKQEEKVEEPKEESSLAIDKVTSDANKAIEAEKVEEPKDIHDEGFNAGLEKAQEVVSEVGETTKLETSITSEQPEDTETAAEEVAAEKPQGEDIEVESNDDEKLEVDETSEKAKDTGLKEWVNNLKEMIRQKDLLECEIKKLKDEKTVSDAEVKNLKEELNKYKTGFARVSELASKSTKFEKDAQNLSEQLLKKDNEIKNLQNKIVNTTSLTESVNRQKAQVVSLTEKLNAMQKELNENETNFKAQKTQYSNKLTEAITVAKTYKAKLESVTAHYIESKANMLGVRPTDITNKLNENYSINDIDAVCEELLESPKHFSNSLFADLNRGAQVKLSETKSEQKSDPDNGYDINDDLLELAGLK